MPSQQVRVAPAPVDVAHERVEPDHLPRQRRVPGERGGVEVERAGQVVDPEVGPGARPQQVLDLLVGLGHGQGRVDVDHDELRHGQSQPTGQPAGHDLGHQRGGPLTRPAELDHVGAQVVGLHEARQGAPLAQRGHVAGRLDASQHPPSVGADRIGGFTRHRRGDPLTLRPTRERPRGPRGSPGVAPGTDRDVGRAGGGAGAGGPGRPPRGAGRRRPDRGLPEFAARVTELSAETGRTPEDMSPTRARASPRWPRRSDRRPPRCGTGSDAGWPRVRRRRRHKPLSAIRALGRGALPGVPAQPPVLPRPAGPARVLDRTDSPRTTSSAASTSRCGRCRDRQALRPGLHPAQTRNDPSTRRCSARTSASCCASTATWSGTSRAAGRARASSGRRGWACSATSSTPSWSPTRPSTTSTWCPCDRVRPAARGGGDLVRGGRRHQGAREHRVAGRFARAQSRRRGLAHVRFGEPLSLRDALDDAREPRSGDPTAVGRPPGGLRDRPPDQRRHPITPAALVTFSLLDNDGRALTLAEVLRVLDPLLLHPRPAATADRRRRPARPDGLRRAFAPWSPAASSRSTAAASTRSTPSPPAGSTRQASTATPSPTCC